MSKELNLQSKQKLDVPEDKLEEYRESFNYYDRDGDGRISYNELKGMLNQLGKTSVVNRVSEIIKELDQNNDGLITFDEYVTIVEEHEKDEGVEAPFKVIKNVKRSAGPSREEGGAEAKKDVSSGNDGKNSDNTANSVNANNTKNTDITDKTTIANNEKLNEISKILFDKSSSLKPLAHLSNDDSFHFLTSQKFLLYFTLCSLIFIAASNNGMGI